MMNDSPQQFYKSQIKAHQETLDSFKSKLLLYSIARIIVYLAGVMGVYIYFNQFHIMIPIALIAVVGFFVLLTRHTNLKAKRNLYKVLLDINVEELKISKGTFQDRYDGRLFQDPKHAFCFDIDLFGKGSFFQYIDRTAVDAGTETLAKVLKANDTTNIEARQEAIKELAALPEWRQLYTAKASLIKTETPANLIIDWLKGYQPFMPKVMQWVPKVFGLLSVAVIALGALQIIRVSFIAYWLFVGLIITAIYLKKINEIAMYTSKVKDTFRQYAQLLDLIETSDFKSELLQAKQKEIQSNQVKASQIFKELSKALDALDNRNNMLSIFFGNGFVLWDIMQSYKIEQWIVKYGTVVEDWFDVVTFFDAYNSLGNFVFNHPDYVYPEINLDSNVLIDAKNLGHPLLDPEKRVTSDLHIDNEAFFIVTGANMAGKSTFLRTVSLHIMMANVGLPVCASSSLYRPIKLITSMRTSDSLAEDSSYFFSELTRLKYIVDQVKEIPYFIILDEILKGTNSTDKAIGSRKFVEKLVAGNATGIIATHDLSLCEIEADLDAVTNYFFDANIINDELYFDYKLKKGVCQNMNASFLLKKMEIV
jgi:hypothetical protein